MVRAPTNADEGYRKLKYNKQMKKGKCERRKRKGRKRKINQNEMRTDP
jgi:hypothetical protein